MKSKKVNKKYMNHNNSLKKKRYDNYFKLTNKKSLSKKGVFKLIEFPLSKKYIYVPDTPDTKTSVVAKAHMKGRRWEPKISAILSKHAKEGTVAIDMGAYIGTHTLALVDAVGPKGKVHTFEPQPWAYSGILKTLQKNNIKNTKVHNVGISSKKGQLRFCSDSSGSSSICSERRPSKKVWAEIYNIPVITLDSLNLKNISVMKVDVEGHELDALKGAKNTIIQSKPVIVLEVWKKRGNRLKMITEFLKSINYNIKNISADDFICMPNN